jgi:hypothetical protein
MSDNEKPKIIVDDDWKNQAQAEKEQLSQEAEAKAAEAELPPMPPANFETLVSGLAMQSLMVMGAIPDPRSGHRFVDLDVAKHHIDSLMMLTDKTKGNLTDDENKMLEETIKQLQMQFVHLKDMGLTRGVIPPQEGDASSGGVDPNGPQV